ncbi:hypothetical protein BDA96_01G261800 [Sorghum bicolor]|uniref:Uncharacterized protein n=1 Tax=Sorghum bicolor TaxID=4558 RepID=A0A921UYH9_SORBI|nr:hypothetical protein BDA96_01G261800 [Sorghum bicolor]
MISNCVLILDNNAQNNFLLVAKISLSGLSGTGMYLTAHPMGHDTAAMATQTPHWPKPSLCVPANLVSSSTMITCMAMVTAMIPRNILLRSTPAKTFLRSISRALNSLNTWHSTKALKIMVPLALSPTPKISRPRYCSARRTATWNAACAARLRHMALLMSGAVRPMGGRRMSALVGVSVASASAPMVSMIRFTHSSCTVDSGILPEVTADTKLMMSAATLTVSWNWMNFWMLLKTQRPHLVAVTTVSKLSFMITMSELSLATSVPWMPMDRPTSASLSAGASLVPSPVTATTWPFCFRRCTSTSLSMGRDRAMTRMRSTISSCSSGDMARNSCPSITMASRSLFEMIPHSMAMARAVRTLSPVTIFTATPALVQASMAVLTSGRQGSLRPTKPSSVSPSSSIFECSPSTCL